MVSIFENHGSFFHSHIIGDIMLDNTKLYKSSGKIKISISDSDIAEEYFSASFFSIIGILFILLILRR